MILTGLLKAQKDFSGAILYGQPNKVTAVRETEDFQGN